MKTTHLHLVTYKESPNDAEIASHKLMLRSGMIRLLSSGLYTWMPLGLRVLQKVSDIVRDEMNQSGALELLMPNIQPAELWQQTGRWDAMGPTMLRMQDRNHRHYCYGPTHEEVITENAKNILHSYKQLPVNFYQIQTKFRDEIRPRFGVMRAREFIMKDAYSFHLDDASLQETYQLMYHTYTKIFTRLGLHFRAVLADSGDIGGSLSHEFHVLAESGEDEILSSDKSDYAANTERAEALHTKTAAAAPSEEKRIVETPGITTVTEQCHHLGVPTTKMIKTLFVVGRKSPVVALVLRGDHELNPLKAQKHPLVASPFQLASDAQMTAAGLKGFPGFIGPLDVGIPVIVDYAATALSDFVCGANKPNQHYAGVNWGRDLKIENTADVRVVRAGDPSPDGQGTLVSHRGIEVGHIFQLGDKYSSAMEAQVLDAQGKSRVMQMGCYGIGVSRIVAAAIEQNHDENGIIWPEAIAPFHIALIPINKNASQTVSETSEQLYRSLQQAGYEVLYDDRDERPGVMFSTMDLIGIPHRLVVGERGLKEGMVEYKARTAATAESIPLKDVLEFLGKTINQ